jgi:ABC-type phosphate transport system substrate-binding protein
LKNRVRVAVAALVLGWMSHSNVSGATVSYQVIVHPSVPGASIDRQALSRVFLKKVVRWGDNRPIEPVDLTSTSPVRATFSADVLGMSTADVSRYWMDAIPAGVYPPTTRPDDRQMIEFVSSKPGSIGYVTAGIALPPTVRAVSVK